VRGGAAGTVGRTEANGGTQAQGTFKFN